MPKIKLKMYVQADVCEGEEWAEVLTTYRRPNTTA